MGGAFVSSTLPGLVKSMTKLSHSERASGSDSPLHLAEGSLGRLEFCCHIPMEVKNSACTQLRTPNQDISDTNTWSFMTGKGSVCKAFRNSHQIGTLERRGSCMPGNSVSDWVRRNKVQGRLDDTARPCEKTHLYTLWTYINTHSNMSLNKAFGITQGMGQNMEPGTCAHFWLLPGILFYFVFLFGNKVSFWSPGGPGSHNLPASASQLLRS